MKTKLVTILASYYEPWCGKRVLTGCEVNTVEASSTLSQAIESFKLRNSWREDLKIEFAGWGLSCLSDDEFLRIKHSLQ